VTIGSFTVIDEWATIEADEEASPLLDVLADLVTPGAGSGMPRHAWHLHRVGAEWRLHDRLELLATAGDWRPLAAEVLRLLNMAALDHRRTLTCHGAAVQSGDRVAILPGDSGLGKSTMSAACLQSGLTYVTDEALAFDDSASSHPLTPYPRPLGLSSTSARSLGLGPAGVEHGGEAWYVGSQLGTVASTRQSAPVTDIVLLHRRPGAATLAQGSRPVAAELLMRQSFNHYKDPRSAFLTVTAVVQRSLVWTLGYAEAAEAAPLLRDCLDGGRPA
jgi:hypothetical protein